MLRKTVLIIFAVIMLLKIAPVQATVLFLESGHHTWTDVNPYYDEVFLKNDAVLDFLGGTIGKLTMWGDSMANLDGGEMTSLWIGDNSVVHYYDGQLDYISASHDSRVFLYAYDVTYDPLVGINRDGYVVGVFYKNDEPFNFSCWNTPTWSHVEIIPEPGTLALIGLGALIVKRRKCEKNKKILVRRRKDVSWKETYCNYGNIDCCCWYSLRP